jgi:hypothetical protein
LPALSGTAAPIAVSTARRSACSVSCERETHSPIASIVVGASLPSSSIAALRAAASGPATIRASTAVALASSGPGLRGAGGGGSGFLASADLSAFWSPDLSPFLSAFLSGFLASALTSAFRGSALGAATAVVVARRIRTSTARIEQALRRREVARKLGMRIERARGAGHFPRRFPRKFS